MKHFFETALVPCRIIALCVSIATILPGSAHGGDPELVHHTLKTEHFNIHYHQGLENLARRTAAIAEEVHTMLTREMGWEVEGPTEVQLEDSQDSANGMANATPYPTILLYAVPPGLDSSLQFNDNWLYALFLHEYVHVIHLQMQHGLSRVINTIFGDVYLPNALQPRWFVEGLAVMVETHRTSRGRIRSSYYDMVIRTHAMEDRFQSLAEASNTTVAYPRGDADYIYGSMFIEYLRERFGEHKLFEICHRYASKPIPYFLNTVFKEATGEKITTLYADWQKEMERRAQETAERVARGLTLPSEAITNTAETKGRPLFAPDGQHLLVPIADATQRSGIFQMNPDGTGLKRLTRSGTRPSLSITDDGRMYYVRSSPYRNIYRYRDLFVMETDGTSRRLTHGRRVLEAAVNRDGTEVAMVVTADGLTHLILADSDGVEKRVLLEGRNDRYYYHPTFHPDGKHLAVVIREDTNIHLALLTLSDLSMEMLDSDDAIERDPTFTADGETLLYSSDRGGIRNIFARRMATGEVYQVTNAVTGAASPAVSPDGNTLAYLYYSAQGWDVRRMDLPLDELPLAPPTESLFPEGPAPKEPSPLAGEPTPYNPLPTLRPRTWSLGYTFSGDQNMISASTSIADSADLHMLAAEFFYEFNNNSPSVAVSYNYLGLLPTFSMSFNYLTDTRETGYLVDGEPAPWRRQSISGDAGFNMNLMGLDDNQSISAGYTLTYSSPRDSLEVTVDPEGPLPDMPTQYFRAGIRFGWAYSDTYTSPFAISTEKGRTFNANMYLYHPSLGGDQELMLLRWGYREYILMPWLAHHVLALSLTGGLYLSNPKGIASFSAGGYPTQDYFAAVFQDSPMGLPRVRGYEPESIRGDHYHLLRLEYRFPIWQAELSYAHFPVFFRRVHAAVFNDNIVMSFDTIEFEDWRASVGGELVWSFYLGYYMPVTLRTGYARGIMGGGINEFILVVGGSF